jgi:hypothetical protein
MSFFSGPPSHDPTSDSEGQAKEGREGGNDNLARAIAESAREFGENHWRWEDMQGYMFRLLLEYVLLLLSFFSSCLLFPFFPYFLISSSRSSLSYLTIGLGIKIGIEIGLGLGIGVELGLVLMK